MTIEERVKQLEILYANLQAAFVQAQKNQVPVTERADGAYAKVPQVDENTTGVVENQAGLLDVAALSDENNTAIEDLGGLTDENSTAIEDLAGLIDDLEERVAALEEKEG